jgi:hypothetical protein
MTQRNLDGVYFRIQRDGKWTNVCFSDMIEVEMLEVLEGRNEAWLKNMCIILARTIRQIGDELDLYGE